MKQRTRRLGFGAAVVALAAAMIMLIVTPASAHKRGRMTGGGHAQDQEFGKVTHGFELYCITLASGETLEIGPNNLEVNWNGGQHWHLEDITRGACHREGPPNPPPAPFNAYYGAGFGRLNGVSGAFACWRLVDNGEPGKKHDVWSMRIWEPGLQPNPANASGANGGCPSPDAEPVIEFRNMHLDGGNHQAHRLTGSKAKRRR